MSFCLARHQYHIVYNFNSLAVEELYTICNLNYKSIRQLYKPNMQLNKGYHRKVLSYIETIIAYIGWHLIDMIIYATQLLEYVF